MTTATYISMFVLGLLGTGHCIGMCGPLVVALPGRRDGVLPHLLYNLGRVLTYAAVGLVLGAIGSGFAGVAGRDDADYQSLVGTIRIVFNALAILFMLVFGAVRLGMLREPAWMTAATPTKLPGFHRVQRSLVINQSRGAIFAFGLLLGMLPCGLSYAAFAMALTAGSALRGAGLVLAFGVGTMPGLLVVGAGASKLLLRHRRLSDLLSGVLMLAMAALLAVKTFMLATQGAMPIHH